MKVLILVILVIGMSGCALLTKPGAPFYGMSQKDKLDKATMFQQQGKTTEAVKLLSDIATEPEVSGITDEALYRLAVLRIGSGFESENIEQGKRDLDRLANAYPSSSWTLLALPLRDFLDASEKALNHGKKMTDQNKSLTRDNRALKENLNSMAKDLRNARESNASLAKENYELHLRVEKLKSIDLEMEKGSKRYVRPKTR